MLEVLDRSTLPNQLRSACSSTCSETHPVIWSLAGILAVSRPTLTNTSAGEREREREVSSD